MNNETDIPDQGPVDEMMDPASAAAAIEAQLPVSFTVGDTVRHKTQGGSRQVWGIRRAAEETFLQFSADGQWQSATDFVSAN